MQWIAAVVYRNAQETLYMGSYSPIPQTDFYFYKRHLQKIHSIFCICKQLNLPMALSKTLFSRRCPFKSAVSGQRVKFVFFPPRPGARQNMKIFRIIRLYMRAGINFLYILICILQIEDRKKTLNYEDKTFKLCLTVTLHKFKSDILSL